MNLSMAVRIILMGTLTQACSPDPLVMLDSGHSPSAGGAISLRGISEVEYNDQMVEVLRQELEAQGYRTELTRRPGEEITLAERAEKANRCQAHLFVSIHHDSTKVEYLEEVVANSVKCYRTLEPLQGYSVFVSAENPQYLSSERLGRLVAGQLLSLGRSPNLKHADPVEGENRPLLDENLGLYRYDELAVLRHTQMPAVLVEMGLIVDEVDEAYVSDPLNQEAMARAVAGAIEEYQDSE